MIIDRHAWINFNGEKKYPHHHKDREKKSGHCKWQQNANHHHHLNWLNRNFLLLSYFFFHFLIDTFILLLLLIENVIKRIILQTHTHTHTKTSYHHHYHHHRRRWMRRNESIFQATKKIQYTILMNRLMKCTGCQKTKWLSFIHFFSHDFLSFMKKRV